MCLLCFASLPPTSLTAPDGLMYGGSIHILHTHIHCIDVHDKPKDRGWVCGYTQPIRSLVGVRQQLSVTEAEIIMNCNFVGSVDRLYSRRIIRPRPMTPARDGWSSRLSLEPPSTARAISSGEASCKESKNKG